MHNIFKTLIFFIVLNFTIHSNGFFKSKEIILFVLPETGKNKLIGDELKKSLEVFLKGSPNITKKFVFLDEGDEDFALKAKIYINKFKNDVHSIIGPVLSKSTLELRNMLDEAKLNIPIYSLSNNSKLEELSNVKIFGFNTLKKINQIFTTIDFEEEDYDKAYFIYKSNQIDRNLVRNFLYQAEEYLSDQPTIYRYNDIKRFSIILKQISINNNDHNHKSLIVFANSDEEILNNIFLFLVKYKLNPDDYDFCFLHELDQTKKYYTDYKNSVFQIHPEKNMQEEFKRKFQKFFSESPSIISVAMIGALESTLS